MYTDANGKTFDESIASIYFGGNIIDQKKFVYIYKTPLLGYIVYSFKLVRISVVNFN
jgi:hypothetical protein